MTENVEIKNRLIVLPLIISRGITNLPSVVISILLIEIGASFNVTPGIAGQISTASSLLSIIFARARWACLVSRFVFMFLCVVLMSSRSMPLR